MCFVDSSLHCKSVSDCCHPICLFLFLFPLPEETYLKGRSLDRPLPERTLPVFSSRSCMVLDLTFKSLSNIK